MAITPVTGLVVLLFLVVAGLLAYGFLAFRDDHSATSNSVTAKVQVNTRREVLWTGISAMLLLAVFLLVR